MVRARKRKWAFGSWSSVITVFTILTVIALSVWLVNQGDSATPKPESNNDFPVVPDTGFTPSPSATKPPGVGSLTSPSASPTPSPTPTPTKTTPPPPKERLHASYSYEVDWFNNVDSTVTVENPSGDELGPWTVVLKLPSGMTVSSAEGARYQVSGQTVTFTPDGNDAVPAKGSVAFTFHSSAPRNSGIEPESCTVNGKPC